MKIAPIIDRHRARTLPRIGPAAPTLTPGPNERGRPSERTVVHLERRRAPA
jgi:hypothetical protein